VATSAVKRDGKIPTGNHGSASHALGPEHPQNVQRGRPVDEHAALVTGGRSEQANLFSAVNHHERTVRHRAYDAALARGKPRVRHGRGDLVEKLSVGFHFAKSDPLDNS
jgi:hypothetical protein